MIRLPLPLARVLSAKEAVMGAGSQGALKAIAAGRAAVILSSSLYRANSPAFYERIVGAESVQVFAAPVGEPTLHTVMKLSAQLEAFRPDWIIAIGGGSVMDAAKLAWAFYEHPGLELERACRPFGLGPLRGKARLAAVPTTAGTGSEVSSAAVFLDEISGLKRTMVTHDFLPDLVILDPALTLSCPTTVTVHSALDALAHALEGYVSRFENHFLDLQAEKAAQLILEHLPQVVRDPSSLPAREQLQMAAMLSGWVQNQKVPGTAHALAHQLGAFGIGHGLAVGTLLVPVLRRNARAPKVKERYDRLAQTLRFDSADHLFEACAELRRLSPLGPHLGKTAPGGAPSVWNKRDEIVAHAKNDICFRASPVPFTDSELAALLEEVL